MARTLIGNVKGPKGDTGAAAGFGTPTASVDSNVGTPAVVVNASGPDTAKVFSFSFHNLKGERGAQGERGPQGNFSYTYETFYASVYPGFNSVRQAIDSFAQSNTYPCKTIIAIDYLPYYSTGEKFRTLPINFSATDLPNFSSDENNDDEIRVYYLN